jgi:cbb3-type cytochrome oxidase maturation protein
MSHLAWLVPIALGMGLVGLAAFLWTMRAQQYEDLDGAAERVLLHQDLDIPLKDERPDSAQTPDRVPTMDETQRRHS